MGPVPFREGWSGAKDPGPPPGRGAGVAAGGEWIGKDEMGFEGEGGGGESNMLALKDVEGIVRAPRDERVGLEWAENDG